MSDFHANPNCEEALARLRHLVETGLCLGVLTGPTRSGKSTVLNRFASELASASVRVASFNVLGVGPTEFLHQLAAALGSHLPPTAGRNECWRAIADRIRENAYQEFRTVVMLDDVDQTERETLVQIARLVRLDVAPTVIATGRPDRLESARELLLDRADMIATLKPAATVPGESAAAPDRTPVSALEAVAAPRGAKLVRHPPSSPVLPAPRSRGFHRAATVD